MVTRPQPARRQYTDGDDNDQFQASHVGAVRVDGSTVTPRRTGNQATTFSEAAFRGVPHPPSGGLGVDEPGEVAAGVGGPPAKGDERGVVA